MDVQETTLPKAGNVPTVIGEAFGGGFYAGQITITGVLYALIVASKAEGERRDVAWLESEDRVIESLLCNGWAEAGSELAQWARSLAIGGYTDWYIPSQDELEIVYRNLKPTRCSNYLYGRSGVNPSAVPPTHAYTADAPVQTTVAVFAECGEQAFADEWYWSSTQHAAYDDYAWGQDFLYGVQDDSKSASLRARAVRRLAI